MEYAFVSYLGTDNFLPGILALNASLKKYNKKYGLLVLITDGVSDGCIPTLETHQIKYKLIRDIQNPNALDKDDRNFKCMYTKLRIFELYEYDRIVYIDSDMLVCKNIEELFDRPHLSAVIAGGLYPGNESWKELNAGLLVIYPDKVTTGKLYSSINTIHSGDGSDQGFLHAYYNDWPASENLHLPHKFNVPAGYLDEYCRQHGYKFSYKTGTLDTDISIIHYWGREKPWDIPVTRRKRKSFAKYDQSLALWWDVFGEISGQGTRQPDAVWKWSKNVIGRLFNRQASEE